MGITIRSMSWRDGTKRVAYSKKGNAYAERYTFETRDDARPELFEGFKALRELVINALINAVKIKCKAEGHEERVSNVNWYWRGKNGY